MISLAVRKSKFLEEAKKHQKLTRASKYFGRDPHACELLTQPETHLPPITKANFELSLWEENYIEKFEYLSLLLRQTTIRTKPQKDDLPPFRTARRGLRGYRPRPTDWIRGEWIRQYFLENPDANLKLIGYHIEGNIDLSGFRACGSLRMICCQLKGAFIFDRAVFRTLDLSGSIFEGGMSGAHSEMTGALRMRRTVSKAPVDIPGVRVDALTDFSDCIIFPLSMSSQESSFVAERGMLNLSGAILRLGIRFQRSRIYGLTNLRGAEIGISFQANDAVLSSSLATFETLTLSYLKKLEAVVIPSKKKRKLLASIFSQLPAGAFAILKADEEIARRLHCTKNETDETKPLQSPNELQKKQIKLETLGEDSFFLDMMRGHVDQSVSQFPNNFHMQLRLLREDHRAAETALRMEGAVIRGPVYFNGAIISGCTKMSGLTSEDRLNFDGAKLRSPESIRQIFIKPDQADRFRKLVTQLPINHEEAETVDGNYEEGLENAILNIALAIEDKSTGVRRARGGQNKSPTLDLLGAKIGGRLTFDRDWRQQRVNWFDVAEENKTLKIIHDAIAEVIKHSSPDDAVVQHHTLERFSREDRPMYGAFKSILKKEELSRRAHVSGHIRLSNARIEGDVIFQSCLFNITDKAMRRSVGLAGRGRKGPKTITMKRCLVVGKLDFRCSFGLHRLDARNATIDGGLMFSDPPKYHEEALNYHALEERAHFVRWNGLNPEVNLKSIRVGGNVTLVFNFEYGPTIKASFSRFDSQMAILPAHEELKMGEALIKRYKEARGQKPFHRRLWSDIWKRSLSVRMMFKPRIWNPFDPKVREVLTGDEAEAVEYFDSTFEPAIGDARNDKKPKISLGGARTAAFAHHPLAWPSQDRLKIQGFEYQTTENFGPLGFGFRMWDGVKRDVVANARRSWGVVIAFMLVALLYELSNFSLTGLSLITSSYVSSLLSALVVVGTIFTLPAVLGLFFKPNNMFPASPTAVDWLRLQRRHFPKRRAFATSRPTDAYLRAAIVMRNAGRDQEAAKIELARLRERLHSWSNRSGLVGKFFSWCLISVMMRSPKLGWLKFLVVLPIVTLCLYLPSGATDLSFPLRLLVSVDSFLPFTNIVQVEFGPITNDASVVYLDEKYVSAFQIHAVWGWMILPIALGVLSSRMESFIAKTRLNVFE